MPFSVSGSRLLIYEKDTVGLCKLGTIPFGTPETTASLFSRGALITCEEDGKIYRNKGTVAAPVWEELSYVTSEDIDESLIQSADILISAADITATDAGKLGHAAGVPLVAAPGANKVVDLISAVMIYDFDTAAYTAGGNITVNSNGGAALTGAVTAANSLGASTDKIVRFVPLSTSGVALTANKGLNLVSSAAFTQPGTAAGVVRVKVLYRVITTGLA